MKALSTTPIWVRSFLGPEEQVEGRKRDETRDMGEVGSWEEGYKKELAASFSEFSHCHCPTLATEGMTLSLGLAP